MEGAETVTTNKGEGVAERPIRVVPDANVLYGDPFLRSVTAQAIISASKFIDIKLVVGDITVDELRGLLTEQLKTAVRTLGDAIRRAELLEFETGVSVLGFGHKSREVIKAWEERWTSLRGVLPIMPYPTVVAEELAERSISERRPFLEGDRGLRDCLLWISILAEARNDDCTYVLVTKDNGFYEAQSEALHGDLEAELARHDLAGRVVVRRSFSSVVDEFVKPRLRPEQLVEVAIKSGRISDFTERDDSVGIALYDYLLHRQIPDEWIAKRDYNDASVDVVEDVKLIDLVSTFELDGMVLVTSKWVASVVIDLSCPGYQDDSETVIVTFIVETIVNASTFEVEYHEVSSYTISGWDDYGERIPC